MKPVPEYLLAAALVVMLIVLGGCSDDPPTKPPVSVAGQYTCTIVNTFPHDSLAFTQGLQWVDSLLYEGTGMYDSSSLRLVSLETGHVLFRRSLPAHAPAYFGEGICVVGDRIYQLTWQNHIGFIYDKNTFDSVGYFRYPTEGWGLTYDGSRFIMSDGSSYLYFWDSLGCHDCDQTPAPDLPRVRVTDNGTDVVRLNELEYINGEVYANVWLTDNIVRIDPSDGHVIAWIDAGGLLTPAEQVHADVLNGIAYDSTSDRLFLTGKYWPKLFEVELVKVQAAP